MKKLATVEAVTSVTTEIVVFMGVMSCSLVKFIKLSKELTALILKVARRQWWHLRNLIITWRPRQCDDDDDDDDGGGGDGDDNDDGHKHDGLTQIWS